jgi:hypothetical protein
LAAVHFKTTAGKPSFLDARLGYSYAGKTVESVTSLSMV